MNLLHILGAALARLLHERDRDHMLVDPPSAFEADEAVDHDS